MRRTSLARQGSSLFRGAKTEVRPLFFFKDFPDMKVQLWKLFNWFNRNQLGMVPPFELYWRASFGAETSLFETFRLVKSFMTTNDISGGMAVLVQNPSTMKQPLHMALPKRDIQNESKRISSAATWRGPFKWWCQKLAWDFRGIWRKKICDEMQHVVNCNLLQRVCLGEFPNDYCW